MFMRLLFIFFIILVSLSCSNKKETQYLVYQGEVHGTFFSIKYQSSVDLSENIDSVFRVFNLSLNNYDPNSLISKINNNQSSETDSLFRTMFYAAKEVYEITDGTFDISVAPIVNEWGFGWDKNDGNSIPDSLTITKLLTFVGMDKWKIIDNKVIKDYPESMLISNAIAKGLSVDCVSNFLLSKNINNFLVEIGGEIVCKGKNPKNENWRVGIDKPVDNSTYNNRENQIIINISDKAIATSGNYRKFIENNNKKYGHSINPKTGYPAENELLSVSVIASSCMIADAYATAFMVSGLEKSLKILDKLNGVDAYFIYYTPDGNVKTYCTKNFENYILN